MASDQHMMETLSSMLQDGETLKYPIFGYVKHGGFQQFAYFAFTEAHFLIAYLSYQGVTDTVRIPLDISSIKIKKSKLFKEHTIDIMFGKKRTYTICACPKVIKIKAQEENFPQFLEYLKDKTQKQKQSLEEINGKKICWQYFNAWIYIMLACMPAVPTMLIMMELRNGNLDILGTIVEMSDAIPELAVMYGFFIVPFAILSIFNRFFFGKLLGVVSNGVLYLDNREISISDIREIIYHPRIITKRSVSFSYATLVVRSKANNTEPINVVHFPLYGLRTIKKYNENIKLKCDKYIWFLVLCPTVVCGAIGFLFG